MSGLITGIVDIHNADGVCDLKKFKELDGGVLFISKATEGGDFVDKGFAKTMPRLKAEGILSGLYHFGNRKTAVAKQVQNFLKQVEPFPEATLMLDCETNVNKRTGEDNTMSFEQAAEFCELVQKETGRFPLFYTYESMLFSCMAKASPETRTKLGRSPLFIAKYGPPPKAMPESWGAWKDWSLWQYSSSVENGPSNKAKYPRGFKSFARTSQDRSCFRGTLEDLQLFWKTCGLP